MQTIKWITCMLKHLQYPCIVYIYIYIYIKYDNIYLRNLRNILMKYMNKRDMYNIMGILYIIL